MKISAIETIVIKVPYEYGGPPPNLYGKPWTTFDTLLVKISTDQGITGWGEAFGFNIIDGTKATLDTFVTPLLIGRDPAQIAALMPELHKRLHLFGRGGPCIYAFSGIDIALWDIAGKIAGVPLYRLLGGSSKTHLPAYASLMRYTDPLLVARHTETALKRGFRYIKLHEIDVPQALAARDAAGDGVPIMLDTNCPWTPAHAIEMARKLMDCDLYWLEEPVFPPENYDGLADVRHNGGIRIAAGENAGTFLDFKHMFDAEAVDIAQPSVTKIGGISEMRKIMTLADAYNVTVHPHSPYVGPGLLATLHLVAASPHDMLVEHIYFDLEATLYGSASAPFNGNVAVPQGPGLGLDPDLKVIERYRTR